jgi:4-hydroxybenzoyl-CoA thioesterase
VRTFDVEILVRFAHCDAAGIVFFPRYFEMLNQTVEDWFAGPLGRSFKTMHIDEGVGVPTARFETDFHKPSRLEDLLTFQLSVQALGRASADLLIRASCVGEARATFRQRIVFVDLHAMRARPWPDDLRARMSAFLSETEPS